MHIHISNLWTLYVHPITNKLYSLKCWGVSCTSNHIPQWWFSFSFLYIKVQYSASSVLLSSHLTTFTHTKSNQYFTSSLTTVFSEQDIGKIFTRHMCIFLCLGDSKWYAQVQGPMLRDNTIMEGGLLVVSPLSNHQARSSPSASCSQLLDQYIYGLNKLNQNAKKAVT